MQEQWGGEDVARAEQEEEEAMEEARREWEREVENAESEAQEIIAEVDEEAAQVRKGLLLLMLHQNRHGQQARPRSGVRTHQCGSGLLCGEGAALAQCRCGSDL